MESGSLAHDLVGLSTHRSESLMTSNRDILPPRLTTVHVEVAIIDYVNNPERLARRLTFEVRMYVFSPSTVSCLFS